MPLYSPAASSARGVLLFLHLSGLCWFQFLELGLCCNDIRRDSSILAEIELPYLGAPPMVRISVENSCLHPNLLLDHYLGIRSPGSSLGADWIAYSGMLIATGEDCRRTRLEVSLRLLRLQRFVPALEMILRLLLVLHYALRTPLCKHFGQLAVTVGFPTRSLSHAPRSELFSLPLAFALPAILLFLLRGIHVSFLSW